ncbi:UNVERIFIED_CONTAM: hypothetical protein RMT77_005843 [Armadillidium vulgare]
MRKVLHFTMSIFNVIICLTLFSLCQSFPSSQPVEGTLTPSNFHRIREKRQADADPDAEADPTFYYPRRNNNYYYPYYQRRYSRNYYNYDPYYYYYGNYNRRSYNGYPPYQQRSLERRARRSEDVDESSGSRDRLNRRMRRRRARRRSRRN